MSHEEWSEQMEKTKTTYHVLKLAPYQEGARMQLRDVEMDLERLYRYQLQRQIYQQIRHIERMIELVNPSIRNTLTALDLLGRNLRGYKLRLQNNQRQNNDPSERLYHYQFQRQLYQQIRHIEKEMKFMNQFLTEIIDLKYRIQVMEEIMKDLDELEAL